MTSSEENAGDPQKNWWNLQSAGSFFLLTSLNNAPLFHHSPTHLTMFSLAASTLARTSRSSASALSSRFFHASAADLAKLNVEGLAELVNLEGQNVLMRVDLNVPLSKEVS